MAFIWLDITLIKNRHGLPLVGISRVELECCRYFFAQKNNNIRFCYFGAYDRQFHEVHYNEIKDLICSKPTLASMPVTRAHHMSTMKQATLNIISKLPLGLQQPALKTCIGLYSFVKNHAPRKIITSTKYFLHCLLKKPTLRMPCLDLKQIIFSPNDVYVSVGLDWEKDILSLYQLKKQLHLHVVAFCHDIIPITFPHLTSEHTAQVFPAYFITLAWTADKIICNSESSLRDLKNFLTQMDAPIPSLAQVRLGSEVKVSTQQAMNDVIRELIKEKYILYVSTIERRKNHDILYKAYTRLVEKGLNLPKLVFVGGHGWHMNDLMHDLSMDPRTQDLIVILHDLSDSELSCLYQHTLFTVFPSLYEGWGLPVDESLAHGKFCLSSNTSSLPEVGGDLIEYIDPLDLIKWVERLEYYITHPEALKKRECLIAENYKPYPWRNTAQFILAQALDLQHEKK